jgi:hypothetical protein
MHKEWRSIYKELPDDQAVCCTRISGEAGYVGSTTYDAKTSTFRTYEDKGNRLVITIWKHDEWYYN